MSLELHSVSERAVRAFGFARVADLTAVVDELVGEVDPAILRNDEHEVAFDLDGISVGGEFKPAGEAKHVGVDDDSGGDAEPGAKDDIAGLSSGAGDAEHLVHGLRDLAVELAGDEIGGGDQGLGFLAKEAEAFQEFLQGFWRGLGHVSRRGVGVEEHGRDDVDACVGALGGQDGGDSEFPSVGVGEGADGVGVGLLQRVEDGRNAHRCEWLFGFARGASSRQPVPTPRFCGLWWLWRQPRLEPRLPLMRGTLRDAPCLAEAVQHVLRCDADAGEDGEILERVEGDFGFAQLLHQVDEVLGEVGLEGDDELLVIDAEGVGGVELDAGKLMPTRMCSSMRRLRSAALSRYQGRVFQKG